jgi:hypothetical protein
MNRLLSIGLAALLLAAAPLAHAELVHYRDADGITNDPVSLAAPLPIGGGVASGATDSGTPVKVGCLAGTTQTQAVTAGQRVNALCDTAGNRFVRPVASGVVGTNGRSNTLAFSEDASAANNKYPYANAPHWFNGTTWDMASKATTTARLPSSAATTNATSAKNASGTLHLVCALNTNAAVRYLKLYDKASAPTVGTDTPRMTIALPPSNVSTCREFPNGGAYFGTGIAYALTTGATDGDSTAVGAGDVVGLNVDYN